jgi:hypothetical protein
LLAGISERSVRIVSEGDDGVMSEFLREEVARGLEKPLDLSVLLARERATDVQLDIRGEGNALPGRADGSR